MFGLRQKNNRRPLLCAKRTHKCADSLQLFFSFEPNIASQSINLTYYGYLGEEKHVQANLFALRRKEKNDVKKRNKNENREKRNKNRKPETNNKPLEFIFSSATIITTKSKWKHIYWWDLCIHCIHTLTFWQNNAGTRAWDLWFCIPFSNSFNAIFRVCEPTFCFVVFVIRTNLSRRLIFVNWNTALQPKNTLTHTRNTEINEHTSTEERWIKKMKYKKQTRRKKHTQKKREISPNYKVNRMPPTTKHFC